MKDQINFQKHINKIFYEKFDIFIRVYEDNILIYKNEKSDINSSQWVFHELKKDCIHINLEKYDFYEKKFRLFIYVFFFTEFYKKRRN